MSLSTSQRQSIKNLVLKSLLERRHLERSIRNEHEACYDISIGVDNVCYQAERGLLIDEWKVVPEPISLSQIVNRWERSSHRAYLYQSQYLAELNLTKQYDPILYNAYRDIFPPQPKDEALGDIKWHSKALDQISYWYADLIEYQPGTLPTGELFRSAGHWNSEHQVEIFETLLGRVSIIVAGYTSEGKQYLSKQICGPGHFCLIPPGAWHITYVLDGPALVFNIYTEHAKTDREVRNWQTKKYTWRSPLEISLVDEGHQIIDAKLIFSEQAKQEWENADATLLYNFNHLTHEINSLPDLFLFSHTSHLQHLEKEIIHQWQLGIY